MNKEEIVKALVDSAEKIGVVETLYAVFGRQVSMRIPYSRKACDRKVDDFDFSIRAVNSLKRAGIFTLGEIVDAIAGENLPRIRNLGKKTENEIKTKVMAFGYSQLTGAEKSRFFMDVLERNVG